MKRFSSLIAAASVAAMVMILTIGCAGPYKEAVFTELDSDELAFVVPTEGDGKKQGSSGSVDEMAKLQKLNTQRIYIPQRESSTGRAWWNYKYVPEAVVLTVSREPVTRDWTQPPANGTSKHDDAISAESKEGIAFTIGATISAHIKEGDEATYLYYYAGRPLEETIDQNIRGSVQEFIAKRLNEFDLTTCQKQKNVVFDEAFKDIAAFYATKGITIDYLGGINGFTYVEPRIQQSIDNAFIRTMEEEINKKRKVAQDTRNKILVAKAEAEAKSAQELFKAEEALKLKTALEVVKADAEAVKEASGKWQGKLPLGIMSAGSGLLFGLDKSGDSMDLSKLLVAPVKQK